MTDITPSQRARELLAAEYEREGMKFVADCIRGDSMLTEAEQRALRAIESALRLPAGEGWPEIGVELPWPELPRCWTGSPVSVVWEEDGERTTRAVYTDDQVRMYARLCWETMARAAAPRHEPGEG